MQTNQDRLKGFMPVKIYQSPSSLYMTCISKFPRDSVQAECDPSLVIEQAVVEARDQILSPLDYQKRQQEAREILLRSQENLLTQMGLKGDSSDEESSSTEEDTDELREPIRLRSEILLNQYKQLYEPKPKPGLRDILPMGELKKGLSLGLSFCLMACTFFALIMCGHQNYFL